MTGLAMSKEKTHFQHETALVHTSQVGAGTRIWAYTNILEGAVIGKDCNICDHVFIENQVKIGDRVTIKCGVQVWDGITLEDDVFVGPNATFTNDKHPRSQTHLSEYPQTVVKMGASIGANATILPGLTIDRGAMIGAGAVVTKNVPPHAIIVGNPARIHGYTNTQAPNRTTNKPITGTANRDQITSLAVEGAHLIAMPQITDLRGSLAFGEINSQLPFTPARYFVVYDVPTQEVRGEHAHRKLHQFLICIKGKCHVVVDDGDQRAEVVLDSPNVGVHVEPMVWAIEYRYSTDAVLLVLASDIYRESDYIRDYHEFLSLKGHEPT